MGYDDVANAPYQTLACEPTKVGPVYESGLKWDWWLLVPALGIYALFMLGITIWMALISQWGAFGIMVGTMAFTFALVAAVLPRKVLVWHDRLQLKFLLGYSMTINTADILLVEEYNSCFGAVGALKFSTSITGRVLVHRKNGCMGMGLLFAPADRTELLRHLRSVGVRTEAAFAV